MHCHERAVVFQVNFFSLGVFDNTQAGEREPNTGSFGVVLRQYSFVFEFFFLDPFSKGPRKKGN